MICADCSELAFHLNTSIHTIPGVSPKTKKRRDLGHIFDLDWKTIEQLLEYDAYKNCDLCKAYVSIMTVELISRSHTNRQIRVRTYPQEVGWDCYIIYQAYFLHPIAERVIFRLWREQISSSELLHYQNSLGHSKVIPQLASREGLDQTAPKSQRYEGVSWAKPIMDVRGPQTVAQLKFWLWKCVHDHPECRMAMSGERFGTSSRTSSLDQSKLPSRILDVGSADSLLVKLVETTTETPSASYVALSHCWGPPDKQPLKTTLDTLEDHIHSGIPLGCLPQTFADAVWVTRELGIRYLWIDSLCIIQDSRSDWEAESQKMSSIYEGATLTLGAAYARDSSEGLFKGLQRPDSEKVVKVYTPMEGSSALAPFVTCFVPEPECAYYGHAWFSSPLAERAWVMQEWSLSRRFVWSENDSLHWKCREKTETEPYVNSGLWRIPSLDVLTSNWHRLMQDYARMQLTYETDRLIALRGIATALKESYRRDQEYHFGIWLEGHKTLSLLFWEITDPHANSPSESCCLQDIPSWSWASVADEKAFTVPAEGLDSRTRFRSGRLKNTRYYYDNRGITADNNGTELHLRAPIGLVQLCLEKNYEELCRQESASRYRRMSIYITNSSPNNSTDAEETNTAVALGCLTLDYTIDVLNCPTPSGITHHVIPLVRQRYVSASGATIYDTDRMLVVEPVNKLDGSKAYRRVGMGYVAGGNLEEYLDLKATSNRGIGWSCWEKILSEMKMEDIVLV